MKAILFILSVLLITAVLQPGVNVSYAQDNCTCAECGYPCKTPMVHASNCKYKNNRNSENKSETTTETKSITLDQDSKSIDVEYQLLIIHSKIKSISEDTTLENSQKEKLFLEQKELLDKSIPENETQKMMYEKITDDLQNMLKTLAK